MNRPSRFYVSAPRAWVAMHPAALALGTMLLAAAATYVTRSAVVPVLTGPAEAPDIPAALIVPSAMAAGVVFGATYMPSQLAAVAYRRLLPYRLLWAGGIILLGGLALALAANNANVGLPAMLRNYATFTGLAFAAARLLGPGPAIVPGLVWVLVCMTLGWDPSPTIHPSPWAFLLATASNGRMPAGLLLAFGVLFYVAPARHHRAAGG